MPFRAPSLLGHLLHVVASTRTARCGSLYSPRRRRMLLGVAPERRDVAGVASGSCCRTCSAVTSGNALGWSATQPNSHGLFVKPSRRQPASRAHAQSPSMCEAPARCPAPAKRSRSRACRSCCFTITLAARSSSLSSRRAPSASQLEAPRLLQAAERSLRVAHLILQMARAQLRISTLYALRTCRADACFSESTAPPIACRFA